MFTYITVGINDLPRAIRFYDAVLATLGIERRETDENEAGYATAGDNRCRFWINHPFDRRAATVGNGSMPAFDASSRAAVDAFHAAAIAHGGKDDGAPGIRHFHPNFYACYVRDPDGNKLSALSERPE
ncbi:MAG: VOC family protein [Allorhizobium sp.]